MRKWCLELTKQLAPASRTVRRVWHGYASHSTPQMKTPSPMSYDNRKGVNMSGRQQELLTLRINLPVNVDAVPFLHTCGSCVDDAFGTQLRAFVTAE